MVLSQKIKSPKSYINFPSKYGKKIHRFVHSGHYHTCSPFYSRGVGQLAHPGKFFGWDRMRKGAQTQKTNNRGLGCANRVRKGFLGGGSGAQGCALRNFSFFFASSSSFLKETLINGC